MAMLPERWRKVGFIGAGSLAEALVGGLVSGGVAGPEDIMVTDKLDQRWKEFSRRWGVFATPGKAEVASFARVLVLATKPADIPAVLEELRGLVTIEHLVISVAAGIPCSLVEETLGGEVPVVRAMPNTSCRVREAATALALGRRARDEHEEVARVLFGAVGGVVTVPEEWLDAVTALSGSGPAYVYLFMEALTEAGIRLGLSPEVSRFLTQQTVLGAARMVRETGEDPAVLRRQVMSPQGTTVAALEVLEEMGFRAALERAVERAAQRSAQIREEISHSRLR